MANKPTAPPESAGELLWVVNWAVENGRQFEIQYLPHANLPWSVFWVRHCGMPIYGFGRTFHEALSDGINDQTRKVKAKHEGRSD